MILCSWMIPKWKSILIGNNRLQTKLGEGNVFTRVCLSMGSRAIPPWNRLPLAADLPPKEHGIRQDVTSYPWNHKNGWYASYWNYAAWFFVIKKIIYFHTNSGLSLMSQCLSGSGCSKDQENYNWTTADLTSNMFINISFECTQFVHWISSNV